MQLSSDFINIYIRGGVKMADKEVVEFGYPHN